MKRCLTAASVILFFSFWMLRLSLAQEDADPRKWTVDDVLKQEFTGSYDISPCGKWVVWVKTRPDKEEDRMIADLYLSALGDSTEIQLTRGKADDRNPKWSPDGKYIAFISSRGEDKEAKDQIWLIHSRGGEPWVLTSLKNGVNSFEWRTPDKIVFSAREDPYFYEQELKKKKDDAIVVGDQEHFLPVRLFEVSVKAKEVERLSMNQGRIGEFAVSPDGQWVVTNEDQNIHYPYDNRIPPRQFLYNLNEKTREEIFTEKRMKPYDYVWTLDAKGFFCSQSVSSDPDNDYVSVATLYYFDVTTKTYERVPLNWNWELGYGYQMTQEGLLTSLANGPWNKLAFYQKINGQWERHWLEDADSKNIHVHTVGKDGRTAIISYTTASVPPRIKVAKVQDRHLQEQRDIIKINPWMNEKYIAKSEIIQWKGAKGDPVDGVLYYPHNYEAGKRYPLMVSIHGGPAGVDSDVFRESWGSYPNVLASRNSFVLKVNYHGSGNYGLKWVESIKGHYYEYEVPDILKGSDYLIKKGLVDPDRLGITGWSNGAILSIQCVIESDRFKVVAPGAGDVNWTSDYGNCAFGAGFDNAYFGGPPWERPDYYIKKSPLFKMEKVSTPTIIFFGTNDTNVPTEQGWEHYRALQQIGKVPVRFILFPGEPHGLRKLSHQRRKMEEELAWFDTYLFQTYEKPNEAFNEDSPLGLALKKGKVKKTDGWYGEESNGVLVPEVVELDSLWIGRFEVTRVQYAAYKKNLQFKTGTENYPQNEIDLEEAKAYCQWLSQVTGKKYRLPYEKEMRKLIQKAKGNVAGENNLDYWAGYAITPDEATMLLPKIEQLENGLLLSVGSFKPVGKEPVYDLGGNVAEWCVDENGQGVILGHSALTPSDSKTLYQPPHLKYVGFRVLLEKE